MFEDSLMESQNRLSSPDRRWTTIVSLTLQCSLVAVAVVLPLLHTEVLSFHPDAPTITLPVKTPVQRVPHVETKAVRAASSATSDLTPSAHPNLDFAHLLPINSTTEEAPPNTSSLGNMTSSSTNPGAIATAGQGTRVALAPAPPTGPVHISRGVSAGLLLAPIRPVYPAIALSTRTEGVVVVEAIISKLGKIERARATSGPELLRGAAVDAIRNAHYSPYLLNGLPTEVDTIITVNFKLAG